MQIIVQGSYKQPQRRKLKFRSPLESLETQYADLCKFLDHLLNDYKRNNDFLPEDGKCFIIISFCLLGGKRKKKKMKVELQIVKKVNYSLLKNLQGEELDKLSFFCSKNTKVSHLSLNFIFVVFMPHLISR